MEPLAALGIAAAGVQFIDFASRLLSDTVETYKSASGRTERITSLDSIATELSTLTSRVQEKAAQLPQSPPPGSPDALFIDACRQCQDISKQLAAVLQPLAAVKPPSKFKRKSARSSLAVALKGAMSQKKIQDLSAQLQTIQQRMQLAALVSLWEKAEREHTSITQQFQQQLNATDPTTTETANYLRHITAPGVSPQHSSAHQEMIKAMWSTAWFPTSVQKADPAFCDMTQLRILNSLGFDSIHYREEAIPAAYTTTFEWLFNPHSGQGATHPADPSDNTASWASFTSWLEADTRDIYWITGKPGSGKSTLMKFLAHHPKLSKHLSTWAGAVPVIIASFYSWNAGADLQRSFEGLLRGLLFQCLQQRPELTAKVCSRRWACLQVLGAGTNAALPEWNLPELMEAFKSVVSMTGETFRLAILIDGLDEFAADHEKLVEFTVPLSYADGVKICVSSRPWNVFNDAFHRNPSLRVQELTKDDIARYVTGHFESLPAFAELQNLEMKEATALLDEIASRADGVFLWVSVVVRSIAAQLSDGARVKDLHATVNKLPQDLELLFDTIKRQTKPEHVAQSAQYFLIVLEAARKPFGNVITAGTLLLAVEEQDSSFHRERKDTTDFLLSSELIMRRRLHSRTMGMLEMDPTGTVVLFLHRTVADWARRKANLEALIHDASTINKPFNANLELVKALATMLIYDYHGLSHGGHSGFTANGFWDFLGICLKHAAWAAHSPGADSATLVHILGRLASCPLPVLQHALCQSNIRGNDCVIKDPFAWLAAAFCISPFVTAKAQEPGLCGSVLRFVVLGGMGMVGEEVGWGPLGTLVSIYAPQAFQTRLELVQQLLCSMRQTQEKRETVNAIILDVTRAQAGHLDHGKIRAKDHFSSSVLAVLKQELSVRTWVWRFVGKEPRQRGNALVSCFEEPLEWEDAGMEPPRRFV